MAGRGSLAGLLPFADANAIVIDMANEVLPVSIKVFLTREVKPNFRFTCLNYSSVSFC